MDHLKRKLCFGDIVAVIAVILAGICVFAFGASAEAEGDVCVLRTPESETVLPLSHDTSFDVVSNGISLTVKVENGEVWVESADCPDKVCVHSGKISGGGRSVICVPARLSLIIETEGDTDADFIVG